MSNNDVPVTTKLAYGLIWVWARVLMAIDRVTCATLRVLKWLRNHPSTSAFGVLAFYVFAGCLLAAGSGWATPTFIFAVALTLAGLLFFGND